MINDVSALRADEGMAAVVATGGAGLCMMHRLEAPGSMAWSPQEGSRYGDEGVSAAVSRFLQERLQACASAGIPAHAVWLDPGLGFGKSVVDNLRLLKDLPGLARLGRPVLVGPSRKSFVGASLGGLAIEDRLAGTLAACAVAVWLGAKVLRVHDVREASQAARLVTAIQHA